MKSNIYAIKMAFELDRDSAGSEATAVDDSFFDDTSHYNVPGNGNLLLTQSAFGVLVPNESFTHTKYSL